MTNTELALNMLAEAATTELSKEKNPQHLEEHGNQDSGAQGSDFQALEGVPGGDPLIGRVRRDTDSGRDPENISNTKTKQRCQAEKREKATRWPLTSARKD